MSLLNDFNTNVIYVVATCFDESTDKLNIKDEDLTTLSKYEQNKLLDTFMTKLSSKHKIFRDYFRKEYISSHYDDLIRDFTIKVFNTAVLNLRNSKSTLKKNKLRNEIIEQTEIIINKLIKTRKLKKVEQKEKYKEELHEKILIALQDSLDDREIMPIFRKSLEETKNSEVLNYCKERFKEKLVELTPEITTIFKEYSSTDTYNATKQATYFIEGMEEEFSHLALSKGITVEYFLETLSEKVTIFLN